VRAGEEAASWSPENRAFARDTSSLEHLYTIPREKAEDTPRFGANRFFESERGEVPLLLPPPPARAQEFEVLKHWDGTVADVGGEEFVAVLRDASHPDEPPQSEAVFALEEVSEGDIHLLVPGAVFTWTIGRETSADGQRRNVDFIRFLRLPAWTAREIDAIKKRAEKLRAVFDVEEPD